MGSQRACGASRRAAAVVAMVLTWIAVFPAAPASATATCASVGAAVNITLVAGDAVTIGRDVAGNFAVSGTGLSPTTCGGATVANRDTINVTGSGGNESVTIDRTEGSFEPGVVNEAGATDEIEFVINLGAGSGDSLTVIGLDSADLITVGSDGINLNDADDVDVT